MAMLDVAKLPVCVPSVLVHRATDCPRVKYNQGLGTYDAVPSRNIAELLGKHGDMDMPSRPFRSDGVSSREYYFS